ncbi:putative nuclease HARBI1 [Diprion similis]|uniref:putative nuclease HARBI1 n=1 Tax=Diprion similis TaxID=362088 RepID=UPI001EF89BFB|nr:putative nuclease HARBI1 [Diprion similis]
MDLVFRNAVQLRVAELLEDAVNQADVRPRRYNHRCDAFDLPERQFTKLFRLNKRVANHVIDIVEQYSDEPRRSSALDATIQVLTTLRFLASGSYQLDIGQNVNMAISQPSVSRSIKEVTNILVRPEVFGTWVKFPNNLQSLLKVRHRFWTKHHFPGVIGCIDCTHVAIFPPLRDDVNFPEHIYVNRKGYHSINVQLVLQSTEVPLTTRIFGTIAMSFH